MTTIETSLEQFCRLNERYQQQIFLKRSAALFAVISYLQEQEGIHLEVKARKVA